MRNRLFILCLASLASVSYAKEGSAYEGPAHYRVAETQEYLVPIERGAYEDLLRVVDEQNRQKGIFSNYLQKGRDSRHLGNVDLVPVAQFVGDDNDKYKEELLGKKTSTSIGYHSVDQLLTQKDKALKEDKTFDKLSYSREGNQKRFYFGNGNTVKDISITGTDAFDKKLEETKKQKNDKYVIEGVYKRPFNDKRDQLGISVEDYKKNIEGQSREKALEYIKQKLESKLTDSSKYKFEIKNGELYTKDENGKEWKVLLHIEPVSVPEIRYGSQKQEYKDDIFTNIYLYYLTPNSEDMTNSRGRVFYTKDNNIVVEDKFKYPDNVVEFDSRKNKVKEEYEKDKKTMSDADFKKKWVTPFEKGGAFEKALSDMNEDLKKVSKEKEEVDKEKEKAEKAKSEIEKNEKWPSDAYNYKWGSEEEKKKYLDEHPEAKELLLEWEKQDKVYKETNTQSNKLSEQIREEIPKKYGFYDGWGAEEKDKKWLKIAIANKDLIRKYLGKNVEFRGQGRIDGVVDLGKGHNQLTIQEQFTGRYGTNIILGPKAALKNIAFVNVSGAIGDSSHSSLSGRTSLTLDIDPSVKNGKGHLIQHAFKDSDSGIVFRGPGSNINSDNRNDFYIELMSSRIAENSVVDMGRKLKYKTQDFKDPAKEIDMEIKIISDSIAHTIENKEEKEDGNSLLEVKIKEQIKALNEKENTVYGSIHHSGTLDILQPTLTTTNKKTTFNVADDDREEKKKTRLIHLIKTDSPEKVVQEIGQFNLSDTAKREAIERIQKIANSDNMKKLKEKTEQFRELVSSEDYKKLDLAKQGENITNLNPGETWQELRQKAYDKATIERKVQEVKDVVNGIHQETIENLAKKYSKLETLKNIKSDLENLKRTLEEIKEIKVEDTGKIEGMFSTVASLGTKLQKQASMTEATLDSETANKFEGYHNNDRRNYMELKNMLFYTIREEEALSELKNIISQLREKNIYSKLNKVAKNELSTYTNLPYDVDRSLLGKKTVYTRGGFISSRTVQKNFKGNIYTGYGIFEHEYQKGLRVGGIVGGANTDHTETYSRTLRTVATESTMKGVSAYAGAYVNKTLYTPNLEWISGLGLQYGYYTVKRQLKNNYQELHSKGHSQIGALSTYTGFVYSHPLQNDLILRGKGILSYSLIHQGKVKEKEGLNLNIEAKDYHYMDGELGISLAKTLYDDSKKSTLSAGVSGIFGLSGYNNKALKAKVHNSSTGYDIVGDKTKKDAVKIYLDYNMQLDLGFNYGLEGTYITNNDQSDVKIGLKAGYSF
ncbi:autotransporter domain-containing protein [Fusobacterium necrophorum subsp. funduliforme]